MAPAPASTPAASAPSATAPGRRRRHGWRSSATPRPTRWPSTRRTASTARSTIEDGAIDGCSVYDAGRVLSSRDVVPQLLPDLRGVAGDSGRTPSPARRPRSPSSCSGRGTCSTARRATGRSCRSARRPGTRTSEPTCRRASTRSSAPAPRSPCSRWRACARSRSRGRPCRRCPSAADDGRVAHVNDVFRAVAAANPATTTFVTGPDWCGDEAMATDPAMRWDGVHVYKPGAAR